MNTKKKALIVSGLLIAVGGYYIYKNIGKWDNKKCHEESVISKVIMLKR